MMSTWLEALILVAGALASYAALLWLANVYSLKTNWQLPQGTHNMNWPLRRNLGLILGGLAVAGCAVASALWMPGWPARFLVVAQAALMAASGASDMRRFHLPLPLTVAGIGLALVAGMVTGTPPLLLVFAVAWAGVVVVAHALVSKGSMQLGDHLATVWIALAAPFNGLVAVAAGDAANVVLARVKGLRGGKVAAAGAWLVLAAALVGLPPYFIWFAGWPPTVEREAPEAAEASADLSGHDQPMQAAESNATGSMVTTTVLIVLTEWAGDYTASVALSEARADRIAEARRESMEVARLADVARRIAPGSDVATALEDLTTALDQYDVDGVRDASLRLVEARERAQFPIGASDSASPASDATINEEQ